MHSTCVCHSAPCVLQGPCLGNCQWREKREGSWWKSAWAYLFLPELRSDPMARQLLYRWTTHMAEFVVIASVYVVCLYTYLHVCLHIPLLNSDVGMNLLLCFLPSVDYWGGWVWWRWHFSYQSQGWSKVGLGPTSFKNKSNNDPEFYGNTSFYAREDE